MKIHRAVLFPVVVLPGCSGAQSALSAAGDQATDLQTLFWLIVGVCTVMFLLVLAFLTLGIWRRRPAETDEKTEIAPPDHGLLRALWLWAGGIVTGLVVLIIASFLTDRALVASDASAQVEVRVTAHQWWWRIEYRDRAGQDAWIETANELHLPVDQTARVFLVSGDVIHSFWVPNLAGKMDVIPGKNNALALTPRRMGWFRGQCTEFCGMQHAHMGLDVKVETAEDFASWLQRQKQEGLQPTVDPVASRGQEIATGGACGLCHAINGTAATGRAGPDLTHVASRRSLAAGTLPMSRGGLQGWIAQPQALKPGNMMPVVPLDPEDADAVAHYLSTLQ